MTTRVMVAAAGAALFLAGWAAGQQSKLQKTVMHSVAFTPTAALDDAKMAEFKQATEMLAQKLPGMKRAWVGKLQRAREINGETRTHGLIFEFENEAARDAYPSHPDRVAWAEVWEQVRAPGAVVYDVMGE